VCSSTVESPRRRRLVFVFEVEAPVGLGLFYEKEVRSFQALMRAVRALDEDSGIRLIGKWGRRRCLVFVTRFGRRFTMMTYSVVGSTGTPGRRLETAEMDSVEALSAALRKAAPRRIRAYVY
jgi:hypothetical protein